MNNPKKPLTAQQAMNRASALCARCEQAPADVRAKLRSWGLGAADVTDVLRQLVASGKQYDAMPVPLSRTVLPSTGGEKSKSPISCG